jgi:hypothetical protein
MWDLAPVLTQKKSLTMSVLALAQVLTPQKALILKMWDLAPVLTQKKSLTMKALALAQALDQAMRLWRLARQWR